MVDEECIGFLWNLFVFDGNCKFLKLEEVEFVELIVKCFKMGVMLFGFLSKEVYEVLVIVMNCFGGKSNSGEGGEDFKCFVLDENGDDRRSVIK